MAVNSSRREATLPSAASMAVRTTSGTWTPSGVTLSYQWYRNSSLIKGATKSTYKLVKADKKKQISIKVTGTKAGYTTLTKTSAKTKKVK